MSRLRIEYRKPTEGKQGGSDLGLVTRSSFALDGTWRGWSTCCPPGYFLIHYVEKRLAEGLKYTLH